jgi:hypothetical protein
VRAFPLLRTEVFSLIKQFAGQSNIITVPVVFIRYAGTLEAALLLSQILYWSDKTEDGWFYKSYREWDDEIALGEYDVRKAAKSLKAKGILETRLKKANGAPTVHYRLKEEHFSESILHFLKNPICENSRNLDTAKSEESINKRLPKTTSKKKISDSEFFDSIRTNPVYSHVKLDRELDKMRTWLALPKNKNRNLTRAFVLRWLNNIEPPLTVPSGGNGIDREAKQRELATKMGRVYVPS